MYQRPSLLQFITSLITEPIQMMWDSFKHFLPNVKGFAIPFVVALLIIGVLGFLLGYFFPLSKETLNTLVGVIICTAVLGLYIRSKRKK